MYDSKHGHGGPPNKGAPTCPTALLALCHDVLNAASALGMNIEFLATDGDGSRHERASAAEVARLAVEAITRIFRELQDAARLAA